MIAPSNNNQTASPLATLGWAFYLGVSWTWCIGMFLPILLVRDYGLWGFVAFAVPNVIGAAAMGWVLRTHISAERILTTHAAAVRAFSVITIAFHVFWLVWLMTWVRTVIVLPQNLLMGVVIAAIAFSFLGGSALRSGWARAVAAGVWIVSGGLLAAMLFNPQAVEPQTTHFFTNHSQPTADLIWFFPISVFGFALCPYLDATFLHARARCGRAQARVAFTLGFGFFFLAMILLTLVYAGFFASSFDADLATVPNIAPWLGAWLLLHLLVQAIFTVELHHDQISETSFQTSRDRQGAVPPDAQSTTRIALLIAVVAAALLGYFHRAIPGIGDLTGGEVVYRVILSCYGLVLPAYVWLCMIPTKDGHAGIAGTGGRRKLITLGVAVLLAAPFYWLGFVGLQEVWLAPGLLIVLLARLTLPRNLGA